MMSQTIVSKRVATLRATPWSEQTDEQLLAAYQRYRNRSAFAELVRRYERELYSYLRRYLGDAAMAEDTFQATFLQVHLKCDQFDLSRSVRPWLYTVATHQAIDAQRRNKRHRMASLDRRHTNDAQEDLGSLQELMESTEAAPLERLEAEERREWIRAALRDLPEILSSAVNLIYYQGLKYREAADVLGVPEGTVKSRLHSAILKLGDAWREAQTRGES